jgi:hypothetical protein
LLADASWIFMLGSLLIACGTTVRARNFGPAGCGAAVGAIPGR